MTTYYIDPAGSDSHAGTSIATAWQTIAKINSSTFIPGDQILLKRGGLWREKLTVPSSGVTSNPILFGAYGGQGNVTATHPITGEAIGALSNDPIIKGSDVLASSGWTQTLTGLGPGDTFSSTFETNNFSEWTTSSGGQSGAPGGTTPAITSTLAAHSGTYGMRTQGTDTSWVRRNTITWDQTLTSSIWVRHMIRTNSLDLGAANRSFDTVEITTTPLTGTTAWKIASGASGTTLSIETATPGSSHVSTPISDATWYSLELQINMADPSISFFINGTLIVKDTLTSDYSTFNVNNGVPSIGFALAAGTIDFDDVAIGTDGPYGSGSTVTLSNTYQFAVAADPGQILAEDGALIPRKGSTASVDANAPSYTWAGGNLYVHSTGGGSPNSNGHVYECPTRSQCILVRGPAHLIFEHFDLQHSQQSGFEGDTGCDSIEVRYVTGRYNGWQGIAFGERSPDSSNLSIHHCLAYQNKTYAGIFASPGAGASIVERNWSYLNGTDFWRDHGLYLKGRNSGSMVARLNASGQNTASGIKCGFNNLNLQAYRNATYLNGNAGYLVDAPSSGSSWWNNVDVGSTYGLRMIASFNSSITVDAFENNILINQATAGVDFHIGSGSQVGTGVANITTLSHNAVFGAPTLYQGTNSGGAVTDQTGTNGNISADPLFVDAANHNYHLNVGSPAIGAGVSVVISTITPPDMGCYDAVLASGSCVGAYIRLKDLRLALATGKNNGTIPVIANGFVVAQLSLRSVRSALALGLARVVVTA